MELKVPGKELSASDLIVTAGFLICIFTLLFGGPWVNRPNATYSKEYGLYEAPHSDIPFGFELPVTAVLFVIYRCILHAKPKFRFILPAIGAFAGLWYFVSMMLFTAFSLLNLSFYVFFAGSFILLLGSLWGIKTEFLSKKN